jgi:hypothetical protein
MVREAFGGLRRGMESLEYLVLGVGGLNMNEFGLDQDGLSGILRLIIWGSFMWLITIVCVR